MPKQPAFPGLRDAMKKKQTRRCSCPRWRPWCLGVAQLANLTFQCLDPVPFFGRDTVAQATVFLGLPDPSAQGLGNTADLRCNGRYRARLRFIGALMLENRKWCSDHTVCA